MDEQIVYALIDELLKELRKYTHHDLVLLMGHPQTKEVAGADGKKYQLEAEVFWDGKKGGDIRVIVMGADGGWRAFKPLTSDFVMAPDGSFVGESSVATNHLSSS
jgi:hypothetical protein